MSSSTLKANVNTVVDRDPLRHGSPALIALTVLLVSAALLFDAEHLYIVTIETPLFALLGHALRLVRLMVAGLLVGRPAELLHLLHETVHRT